MPVPAATVTTTFVDRLSRLVAIDSPSYGREQERVATEIESWLAPLGCTSAWVDEPDGPARSLVITLAGDGDRAVALLGHTDTVFGLGEAARRPFAVSGDRCTGPGVADMKGGLVLAAMAMEQLAAGPRPFSEVRFLICADEEVRLRVPGGGTPGRGRRRGDRVRVRPRERRSGVVAQGRGVADAGADRPPGPCRCRHRSRPQRGLGPGQRDHPDRGAHRRAGRR